METNEYENILNDLIAALREALAVNKASRSVALTRQAYYDARRKISKEAEREALARR